jgi:hypothetical protein
MAFVVDVSLHILASSLIANTITSRASATLNACARPDRGVWGQQWNRALHLDAIRLKRNALLLAARQLRRQPRGIAVHGDEAQHVVRLGVARGRAATCNTGSADLWQA